MSGFKFLTDNYAETNVLAGYQESSEQSPLYPIENIFAPRRSKVWRSNGYWNVESGSNTIVFTEGGSDFTATIAVAEYVTTASFMTAIDAAFTTATGASGSYTVTQNSDLKFVITKSAGTFTIKWSNPSSADMAAMLGFSTAADDTGALAYTADFIRIHQKEFLRLDLGIARMPNAVALVTRRNVRIPFSPSAVIKVIGNHTNTLASPVFEQTIEYDDEIFMALSETDFYSSSGLRFWWIYFEDISNPKGYLELGHFMLGRFYSPTRGKAQFPLGVQLIDRSETITAESGATFSNKKQKTLQLNTQWVGFTSEEKEQIDLIWEKYGTSKAFFISADSNEVYSSGLQRYAKLVKFSGEPSLQLVSPNHFTGSMSFLEEI